jgi:histidine triad (HIT) family protein
MAGECLFCGISEGKVPAAIVYEDDDTIAFRDINPQAPTHLLIIPRRHIASVNELEAGDAEVVGKLFLVARELAAAEGLAESGYRLVMNTGPGAGQTVHHIHLHLLGGRSLHWPPG